jgi:hypothetical protein
LRVENFLYDELDRMTQAQVVGQPAVAVSYDSRGNILSKSDVGAFSYGVNAGPHAVTAVSGPMTASYTYDAKGSQVGRSVGGFRTVDVGLHVL